MDTIFVKQVKEGGPAHGAGLCTGDRIVKVNGESIIGKTYSQVIALIQNSDTTLELCVMPKDEDILQLFSRDITALAYSHDAYLKGNEAYSGNANNIPEPPPICYPRIDSKASGMAQVPELPASAEASRGAGRRPAAGHSDMSYRVEIPVPPSPPTPSQASKTQTVVCVCNENVRTVAVPPEPTDRASRSTRAGPSHRTEENRYGPVSTASEPNLVRPRAQTTPASTGGPLQYTPNRPAEPSGGFSCSASRSTQVYPDKTPNSLRPPLTTSGDTFPSPTSPSHYNPSPPSVSTSPCSPHQNIDWRNYTTYKEYIDNKRLYMYGCRTIQERLDSLRAASAARGQADYKQQNSSSAHNLSGRRRSASHDRARQGHGPAPLRSASQDRLTGAERSALARDWPRSASQDALPSAPAGLPKPRARSCDYLGRQGEALSPVVDRNRYGRTEVEERLALHRGDEARSVRQSGSLRMVSQPHRNSSGYSPEGRGGSSNFSGLPITPLVSKGSEPALSCRADSLATSTPASGSRHSRLPLKNSATDPSTAASSYVASALASVQSHISSSTSTDKDQRRAIGNHLSHTAHQLQPRGRSESLKDPSRETGHGVRSASCSAPSKNERTQQSGSNPALSSNGAVEQRPKVRDSQPKANGKEVGGIEGPDATVVVVRREKIGPQPIRHPSYIQAVNETERGEQAADANVCWLPNDTRREVHMRRLDEQHKVSCSSNLNDSLDSIPFIDEPSSPSIDHDNTHIPASAVISSTPIITTIPASPTSPVPALRRQLSHDQDSLRLSLFESDSGTKTERSKSCDEGLDNYREEGTGRSIKPMPGLKGLKKVIDKSSDDSGSRRDSSSDLFSDATKEGPLHFRQLNSEGKGKRVGGGMRPWKQVYAVLRGHTLCLYKDKKDGQAHANCQTEDEPLSISVKACLIDISYSETKRKNVLRLTTSDSEYLFQAEDREDMLSWIRVIQENSNLDEENAAVTSRDLISRKIREYNTLMSPTSGKTEPSPKPSRQSLSIRQTLLGGKGEMKAQSPHSPNKEQDRKAMHKDETSPPKDKATWRKGIPSLMRKPFEKKASPGVTFGVRLDDCPPAQTNRFVPLIVEVCCKLVEERGLEYTGIYRVPGNNAAISNMQEELNNKGMGDIDIQDDKWRDLNVISSLLKSFFRKLPEPLFTNEKYADFIEANRIEDPVERLKGLKRLLHELPDHHYETLKFLSAHLKTVAENSEKNKMEPRNLAIVFGPTLVRTSEDNMTHMVTHMPDQYKIVETLIQHYDWFFTGDDSGEPVATPQQENAVESQPVPNIDHLLTNIGRTGTSPGDVSDSPTSDSAKSKGSWGSGKDQYSRDLLVSSIFAAASRKRKKHKEKQQPSSSDDDLDSVFPKMELASPRANQHAHEAAVQTQALTSPRSRSPSRDKRENSKAAELTPKSKKELRNSFFSKEKHPSAPSPSPSPSPKHSGSPSFNYRTAPPPKSSLSDPSSQLDEPTSDLGTMSSGASVPRARPKKWGFPASPALELPPSGLAGASATAEVSSITSDYSTTSSTTFLTGAESSALSPEVHSVTESRGGEEADDERSELISEGRPIETDSECDFPVFARGGAVSPALESPRGRASPDKAEHLAGAEGNTSPKLDSRRLVPSHRLIECDTLSRRRSWRQKTDSDSSVDGGGGSGSQPSGKGEPTRLSRVLEVMKKGRSTGSLYSSSRNESERTEPAWHLKITERLKLRLRTSADDMFGVSSQKNRSPDARYKKKNIRRRHTMGGQRDFAELAVINDWREQGGVDQGAELSAVDRLKPKCSSQDLSIGEWIARERCRAGGSQASLDPEFQASQTVPDADGDEAHAVPGEHPSPSASPKAPPSAEQVNGGGPQGKSKSSLNTGADAHPHKLSGAQVVRSRFYQCL
ncbi:rho GTPase-activating protein 21a [Chanos chanos]|uniref:Rho GTPase-activating protein 21a n=1 Tax=Chanos chanos TaxID=29144 RepID=A0A6J2UXP4_CHACN|nr:rho GTPase-activating protein 21 [Chanos chanos]